jgi:hypothetical protein
MILEVQNMVYNYIIFVPQSSVLLRRSTLANYHALHMDDLANIDATAASRMCKY